MQVPSIIQSAIQEKLKKQFSSVDPFQFTSVGGGCINDCYRLTANHQQLFCKINSSAKFPKMFLKEKNELELIQQQNVIKVPSVIGCFDAHDKQVIILEWIREGERTESFWKNFGERLAALHKVSFDQFGLEEDNYMGSVVQQNKQSKSWSDFFIHQRLQPLIEQCLQKNIITSKYQKRFERLYQIIPSIFNNNDKPSLLHGDLWSGNFICNENSQPVLIDPAVYFGHRSVDLAMTTLFGGFHPLFFEAYNYYFPFPSNYKEQWKVCNLYPLLIHLLLFGSGYLSQIENILKAFE